MTTIADLLARSEPTGPRGLGELVGRLERLERLERTEDGGVADVGTAGTTLAGAPIEVRSVTDDSRRVGPGSLFVAIPGFRADGHAHLADAARAGAVAAIVERPVAGLPIPQIVSTSTRRALAEAAAWWYRDPSRDLGVIGVTGTDGKTTTSLMAAAALEEAGIATGVLGTVATRIGGIREANAAHSTTPDAMTLQRALRAMVDAGDEAVVLETTSHGLALDRVAAIDYDVAIFTNLTHEHLELHGTFERYRAAKVSLFERLAEGVDGPAAGPGPAGSRRRWPRAGIVNIDDPSAAAFVEATRRAGARLVTYGRDASADVRLLAADDDAGALRVRYRTGDGVADLRLGVGGTFNALNALAVVALGRAIGLGQEAVRAGLERFPGVPGRMERIDRGQPFRVVVDYAHSPASLALVLDELGATTSAHGGSLIAVFGSAGERDREKRPMMGRIAAERCRVVIATDEDPRGEDRAAILAEIAAGASGASRRPEAFLEIADRSEAIREAFARARPGDIVLLAGKGHEATIESIDGDRPWNERAEAEAALAEMGFRT